VFGVTTGDTVATCTAAPLFAPFVVTTAVRIPAVAGLVLNVTVSDVVVADVTVPVAPLLNTTVFLEAIGSNPKPAMVSVAAMAARLVVLGVTTGVTVAIRTGTPLLLSSVVTTTVKLPAVAGLTVKVIVKDVFVASVTTPTAPSFRTTVLLAAIGSNKDPAIVMDVASAGMFVELGVTTGTMPGPNSFSKLWNVSKFGPVWNLPVPPVEVGRVQTPAFGVIVRESVEEEPPIR
jgi:hypothetical protein